MATVPLLMPPGVVRGATPFSTPGRWWDVNAVRWRVGALTPLGGWERTSPEPLASVPRRIMPWMDNVGVRRAALACDTKLLIETSGDIFDATPSGFVGASVSLTTGGYGSNTWNYDDYGDARPDTLDVNATPYSFSLATWGQDLLALFSSDGRLVRYTPTAPTTIASVVSGAPTALRAMVVTDERHVMVIGGSGTPRRVSWSSREDYSDWDFASTVNTAGFIDLQTDGPLLDMLNVREGVLVFGDSDVFLVRYVGLPFVYGVEKIATAAAPISPRAITPFEGRAVWMGREGFWLFDGGSVRALKCDFQDWIYSIMRRDYARFYAAACNNGVFPEVWFMFPDETSEDGENTRVAIWSHTEGWWSTILLPRSAMAEAGVYRYPIASDTAGSMFEHELGYLAAGDSRVGSIWAESSPIQISEGGNFMSVTRAMLDSQQGAASSRVSFYTQQTPDGAEVVFGPYNPRADGYTDVRFSARDVRVRVEPTIDNEWSIGVIRLQIQPRGKR